MSIQDVHDMQAKLDKLEARALHHTGAEHVSASLTLVGTTRQDIRRHLRSFDAAFDCRVSFGAVTTPHGKLYPADIHVGADCPLEAIEQAFAELKARAEATEGEAA
ncbi:hypothetical protein [Oceanicaulis sp.]|uniref:hypothetical protein n=1 Tax=Oceanicaulis sp. TaxID=1924941 RepID=UPI003D2B2023